MLSRPRPLQVWLFVAAKFVSAAAIVPSPAARGQQDKPVTPVTTAPLSALRISLRDWLKR
jgi:hypothetical protein